MGNRTDIKVHYKSTVDIDNNDIEERYKVSTTGKEKMSLSITVYHSTDRILIQGKNKKEWVNNEYEKLKKVIDLALIEEDIVRHYLDEYKLEEDVLVYEDEDDIKIVADKLVEVY